MAKTKKQNIKNVMIGRFFKEKRIEASLSQVYIASSLGYDSPQMVSNWERGLCAPPYDALKKIVELYGLSKKDVVEIFSDATKEELKALLK